jgi:hypothetical protein
VKYSFTKKNLRPVLTAGILTGIFTLAVLAGTAFRVRLFGGPNDLLFFSVTFPTISLLAVFPGWKGDGSFGDRLFEWAYPPPTNDWFAFLVFSLVNALIAAFFFAVLRFTWRLFLAFKTHSFAK